MKKRISITIITVTLVLCAAAGVVLTRPQPLIPNTGRNIVFPPYTGQLDVAQQDEIAKLADYPVIMPPYTGELDVAQQDEVAKLSSYPTFPPYTGELDLGQQDEMEKLNP